MIPYILPPIYEPASISEQVCPDIFKFGCLSIFNSSEKLILDQIELFGGVIVDRKNIEKFIKDNSVVAENLKNTVYKLLGCFQGANLSDLSLEYVQMWGEESELFLIIKTNKSSEDIRESMREFDDWFVPNVFKEFTRFNINVEFI